MTKMEDAQETTSNISVFAEATQEDESLQNYQLSQHNNEDDNKIPTTPEYHPNVIAYDIDLADREDDDVNFQCAQKFTPSPPIVDTNKKSSSSTKQKSIIHNKKINSNKNRKSSTTTKKQNNKVTDKPLDDEDDKEDISPPKKRHSPKQKITIVRRGEEDDDCDHLTWILTPNKKIFKEQQKLKQEQLAFSTPTQFQDSQSLCNGWESQQQQSSSSSSSSTPTSLSSSSSSSDEVVIIFDNSKKHRKIILCV